jgi:hypothetical protein
MGLFNWLGGLVHSEAEHKTQIFLAADHVLVPGRAAVSPVAEEHYIRLWLFEMFLRDKSSWFTKRYPLTYSLVELNYGGKATEFANVSGKNRLEIKQTDLGRSLLYNYPMTPLLPFRGGTIAIDCGLVSMTASNLVTKFAGVVSEFAGKLGGAQVSAAADMASSIASGVQDLLGAGDAVSKLYYHNAFTGAGGGVPLTSGYIFLSEKAEGEIKPASLWVTQDGIRTGSQGALLQSLDAQDYLVIQIECLTQRDDYRAFTYVSDPFEQALDAKLEGDEAKAQTLLRQAKRAVQKSLDFTKLDARRIVAALDAAYANDGFATSESVDSSREAFEKSRFASALELISIDEAREMPDTPDEEGKRDAILAKR